MAYSTFGVRIEWLRRMERDNDGLKEEEDGERIREEGIQRSRGPIPRRGEPETHVLEGTR